MSEEYKQTLLTYLPILGINAVLIPLFTVRTRLINNIVSQPCDKQTNGGSSSVSYYSYSFIILPLLSFFLFMI